MVVLLGMILGDIALIVKIEMLWCNVVQALMGYLLVWKLQLVRDRVLIETVLSLLKMLMTVLLMLSLMLLKLLLLLKVFMLKLLMKLLVVLMVLMVVIPFLIMVSPHGAVVKKQSIGLGHLVHSMPLKWLLL